MHSKKMRQTFLILFSVLSLSALAAWLCSVLGAGANWVPFFAGGAALMLVGIVPLFFHKKHPKSSVVTLVLNVFSCGLLIGSYFIGVQNPLSFLTVVYALLASCGVYFLFMLLLSVPVLNRSRAYIVVAFLLWAAGLFTAGGILWNRYGEGPALFTLLSIVTALFTFASLFDADSFDDLLFSIGISSSCAVGLLVIVVLLLLLEADDCGCDCSGGDCCDCSTDYDGISTKKKTTMSSMSDGGGMSGRPRRGCKR